MTFDTMYKVTSYENYGDFFPLMPPTNLTEDKAVTKGNFLLWLIISNSLFNLTFT